MRKSVEKYCIICMHSSLSQIGASKPHVFM